MTLQKNKIAYIHIPKTGGGFLDRAFYKETKNIRRNYYLSFIGNDDSSFIHDKRSTNGGNKCRVELAFSRTNDIEQIKNGPHFKECYLFSGHFTSSIDELFPEYLIKYFTIIREPIIRTLSNMLQFTNYKNNECYFYGKSIKAEKFSLPYWEWMYERFQKEYPFKKLSIPENLFFSDIQTRILQGSKYVSLNEKACFRDAISIVHDKKIRFSLFEDFNKGLQKNLNHNKIPINLEKINPRGHGIPISQTSKINKFGMYYGAPQKLIDLIETMNYNDILLYEKLAKIYNHNSCS